MDDYQHFLQEFRAKPFKKGEVVLWQGQVPPCVYVIKSGVVKVYNLTSQGEEKPIGFNVAHDIFPLSWALGKAAHAQYYYEASSNLEVYCVPPAQLLRFLGSNSGALMFVFRRQVEQSMGAQIRIDALERSKASCKVVNTIHYLCLRFGEELKKDIVKITLPLTQQDIANLTGLTRETTGLELKKLNQQGVLTNQRRYYTVHTDKLNGLLDEEYDIGLQGERPTLKA